MKNSYLLTLSLSILLLASSCKKEAGEGGSATIKGVLYSKNVYNQDVPVTSEDYEPDQKIYISYGDKDVYDDDMETAANGSFQFKYLREGTYRLSTYSIDPVSHAQTSVSKTVTINSNTQIVNVDNFIVYKEPDKGGESKIKGRVWVKNYDADWTYIKAEYPGSDLDVYIVYGDGNTYNERIKTSYDGTFEFNGLRKGNYKIYAYSDDKNSLSTEKEVVANTSITQRVETIVIPDIVVIK